MSTTLWSTPRLLCRSCSGESCGKDRCSTASGKGWWFFYDRSFQSLPRLRRRRSTRPLLQQRAVVGAVIQSSCVQHKGTNVTNLGLWWGGHGPVFNFFNQSGQGQGQGQSIPQGDDHIENVWNCIRGEMRYLLKCVPGNEVVLCEYVLCEESKKWLHPLTMNLSSK